MKDPQYLKIYRHFLGLINNGVLKDGDPVATEMEMTKQFEVSRVTVRKALEMLVSEGYLSRKPGRGTVVTLRHESLPGSEDLSLNQDIYNKVNMGQKFIGFILPDISSSYGMKILEGIEKEAEARGYYLVMKLTKGNQELEKKAIRDLLILGASGLIIQPQHGEYYNPVIMELALKKFPFVLVDLELKGLKCSYVGTDNEKASHLALSYFLNRGHRDILYLSPPIRFTSALEDRLEGARKAFDTYGLSLPESNILTEFLSTMPGQQTAERIEQDKKILRDHLRAHRNITAIFACEYHLALLASVVLKELNLNIPDDISLLCFDSPSDYLGRHDFTHVRQNEYRMGVLAMEKLWEMIEGASEIQRVVLPVELVEGDTTKEIKRNI